MILQSLCDLYQRLEDKLPPLGFEEKDLPYIIVVDQDGHFVDFLDNSEEHEGKFFPRAMRVPKAATRSGAKSYAKTNCLWDHYGYIVGQPKLAKPDAKPSQTDIDMANKQHVVFKAYTQALAEELPDDIGVKAVNAFLNSDADIEALKAHERWEACLKIKGCNLSFRLAGASGLVCESKSVIDWVKRQPLAEGVSTRGICLVTGEETDIARLHYNIAGVAQKPSPLASINDRAYTSFGKDKGYNFPVGVKSAFQYATSLNYLLRKFSPVKFRICDTSYVCWSKKSNSLEEDIPFLFTDAEDNPEQGADRIKHLFASLHNGAYRGSDGRDDFFVFGLAPNSARIVVRFWQRGTVAGFTEKLGQWFSDLEIIGYEHFGYPALKKLLRATVLQYKDDNIPPNLPADSVRAILTGAPLPETLAQAVLRRIKAEQGHVTYHRAALLKAYLNRKNRYHEKLGEMTVSLNVEEKRIGYCLGRLFAELEKLQKDAHPNLNATIRDRYYSAASCTPKSVFGALMRLSTHHLKKIEKASWRVNHEKNIGEIMSLMTDFPSHLNLENQGLFAIGYYHQLNSFYSKKTEQGEVE